MPAKLHTSADLVRAMQAQFPAAWNVSVLNSYYVAPTRAWVEQTFRGYIWAFETARGQLAYKARGNQCEHFALRAALEAVDLLSRMPADAVPAQAESLAIACVKYLQHAGQPNQGWHMINLWFHEGAWAPWEPQTRSYVTLTEAERLSVMQPIIL